MVKDVESFVSKKLCFLENNFYPFFSSGAGGIFSSGPPQRAESVELIYFRERIGGNCQSFAVSTLP